MKLSFGNSSSDDSGDFNDDDLVNEGMDKNDEYIENAERDEDDNIIEDIDDYYERKEAEKDGD